ncbi:uncharacterized protein LOC142521981 [Primulina tabacum]|uniref:uncharacterized protein LOC142521981 n=1 Tax=Primulina tabacum TaxID=48773 RepID=UPI003F59D8AA
MDNYGDFNNVLSQDEKKRGLSIKNYETQDFVDCVASLDLLDLRFTGCFFTWMSPKVCSKLDRVLVNQRWNSSNLDGFVEFKASGCVSDHVVCIVCIVSVLEQHKQKLKPFKFLNMWTLTNEFVDIVISNWRFNGHGTLQYCLKQLFKGLKQPLEVLNIELFSNISARAVVAKNKLETMQEDMLPSGVMLDDYREVKKNTEMLLESERLFIAQKAKLNYLKHGDKCTKFFHDLIKKKNKRNAIIAIQNQDGITVTKPLEMAH